MRHRRVHKAATSSAPALSRTDSNEVPSLAGIKAAFAISRHIRHHQRKPVVFGEGKRPEEHCIHHAINGRIGANAQCERCNDDEGPAWGLPELTEGEAQIVPRVSTAPR